MQAYINGILLCNFITEFIDIVNCWDAKYGVQSVEPKL